MDNRYSFNVEFNPPNKPELTLILRSMVKSDIPEAATLVADARLSYHPLFIHIAHLIKREAYIEEMKVELETLMEPELSFVCVDKATDKLVAFRGGVDLASSAKMSKDPNSPIPDWFYEFTYYWKKKYPQYYEVKAGTGCTVGWAAAHPDYQGYKIHSKCHEMSMTLPAFTKLKYTIADATSKFGAMICTRGGGELIDSISYEEYLWNGENPFKNHQALLKEKGLSPDHTHNYLFLFSNKDYKE